MPEKEWGRQGPPREAPRPLAPIEAVTPEGFKLPSAAEEQGTQSTYEAATRCPRCQIPGEVVSKVPSGRPGTQIHNVFCRNEACVWYNTSWIVQVNPDGSVPPPTKHKRGDIDKLFPKLAGPPEEEQRVIRSIERQVEREQQPGFEVRNPRG